MCVGAFPFFGSRSKTAANDSDRCRFVLGFFFVFLRDDFLGSPCNVDVSALMELALERGVHWKSYRTWIQKQVASQQQQQM
jgi:hypothetical protein